MRTNRGDHVKKHWPPISHVLTTMETNGNTDSPIPAKSAEPYFAKSTHDRYDNIINKAYVHGKNIFVD